VEDYTISGVAMVIVGVLLITIGGGTAVGGMNKIDAAEEWEPPETGEVACTLSINTSGDKSFVEQAKEAEAESDCSDTSTVKNPYTGGEKDIAFGGLLVIIGGLSTYFGNKK